MINFTESELRRAEQNLAEISRRCADCLRQEQDLRKRISNLRNDLSRCKANDPFRESKESDLARYERELDAIMEKHMRQERERDSCQGKLNRLRSDLEFERRIKAEEARRKAVDDKRIEDYRRRCAERVAAEAAAKKERAYKSNYERPRAKAATKSSRPGRPKTFSSILIVLLVLVAISLMSKSNTDSVDPQIKDTSPAATNTADMGMIDYIGLTVSDIEDLFGKDYTTEWLSVGGYWMVYPDCAYYFFYVGDDYGESTPKPDDVIYGVISDIPGTTVLGTAKIGMSHSDFEAGIGQKYTAQLEADTEYTLPVALLEFEAQGANAPDKSSYKILLFEDAECVVYVSLSKCLE